MQDVPNLKTKEVNKSLNFRYSRAYAIAIIFPDRNSRKIV